MKKSEQLLGKCRAIIYEDRMHAAPWRNEVAKDLNALLGRVEYTLETDGCDVDCEFAEATLRIIERVAEFEDIEKRVTT